MDIRYFDAIVVGTGAAGYNAANRIRQMSDKTVAIVTEGIRKGTSRNTGSDKQTYYKLGLGGSSADSVQTMARDLFAGGSVDGDSALCEAALSARCFLNLAELGVPFPVNRYGEYVGYKTDHDPYARATSAGPLTSKFMTEALEKKTAQLQIPIFDSTLAVEVLRDETGVLGLLCMDTQTGEYRAFGCGSLILATGGPAGIYADSVYPLGHTGATALALEAGVPLQNMTEWQYGLASTNPRWNVSGTYMQVLPRFVSLDEAGIEREFLGEYFEDPYEALSAVFLKGYQWPFDSRKVLEGSSVIDLLVYRERVMRGRRVYLDYRKNPFGLEEIDFQKLSPEAYEYLNKAEGCFGTPIERLKKLNQPAIDLYLGKGVDITGEMLEIAFCAQHNNGGIAVDLWWQTALPGLFAAGECAGTHGVTRPGGSALNAGQVGSLRAAQYICAQGRPAPQGACFEALAREKAESHEKRRNGWLSRESNTAPRIQSARRRMSDCGAAIRDKGAISKALEEIRQELADLDDTLGASGVQGAVRAYKLRDLLLTQQAVLTAMADFASVAGGTRGSALYTDPAGQLRPGLEELFRFQKAGSAADSRIQEVCLTEKGCAVSWRPVRPLPEKEDVFETVWRQYRENQNVW